MTDNKLTWAPISDGSKVRLANAAVAAAQAKCDRIDAELAAIAADDHGANTKLMDLTERLAALLVNGCLSLWTHFTMTDDEYAPDRFKDFWR